MTIPFSPPGLGPRPTSSLVALQIAMQAYFEAVSQVAIVYLGLKERDRTDQSRVVIIDGEFDGASTPKPRSAGRFGAPWQKQSSNPRELVSWERPITLSIRAVDPSAPDSEAAQTQATELLIEQTAQALHNAVAIDPTTGAVTALGQANVDWSSSKAIWVDAGTATQQTWGKEFLVSFTYKCVLFDLPIGVALPKPALAKGPMLVTPASGSNATIVSAMSGAGTAVIGNLGPVSGSFVGMSLALSGASSPGNNGAFFIAALAGPSSLVIGNANAVAPDASSGSIAWQVVPTP